LCVRPPETGGRTCLADSAAVLKALPSDLVRRFDETGWILARNYNGEVGVSVTDSFGTDDPEIIRKYCRENDISCEWLPNGTLRTWQRRPAVRRHPVTGERCWFNQIAFLNAFTMEPEIREYLTDFYGADGLPFTTYYGDGAPIPQDVVETINGVYDEHSFGQPWRAGDLLLVDNLRMAHSTEAYTGTREIVVGLADPVRS
jgi:alpha-ketoglutarate-dependent taurine dioxygenase